MFTVILMPFLVAALMLPMVAGLAVLKAEDKRRSEEVRVMLTKKPPRPIADAAVLEAEVEAAQAIRF